MDSNSGYQLNGTRVVITSAGYFMGPHLVEAFAREGADVIPDHRDLTHNKAADNLINEVGEFDVLIVNLASERPNVSATEISNHQITTLFEEMVYPLMRIGRAALPQMIARRSGKIIVMGSASALKGFPNSSAYAAARGAQLSWVRSTGVEVAPHNVQVNAIAQIFVENQEYFSTEYQQTDEFKRRINEVPVGRLGTGAEDAALAMFLASSNCNFLVGQAIPFTGGWVS
jgi:2-keto-3-deoxy-L-fuconate dehydrogenase